LPSISSKESVSATVADPYPIEYGFGPRIWG
jgi:hypothetical protein